MYVLNAEIEDKKTLDTLISFYKLLGIKPHHFTLEKYQSEIAKSRKDYEQGNFSSLEAVVKKIK